MLRTLQYLGGISGQPLNNALLVQLKNIFSSPLPIWRETPQNVTMQTKEKISLSRCQTSLCESNMAMKKRNIFLATFMNSITRNDMTVKYKNTKSRTRSQKQICRKPPTMETVGLSRKGRVCFRRSKFKPFSISIPLSPFFILTSMCFPYTAFPSLLYKFGVLKCHSTARRMTLSHDLSTSLNFLTKTFVENILSKTYAPL